MIGEYRVVLKLEPSDDETASNLETSEELGMQAERDSHGIRPKNPQFRHEVVDSPFGYFAQRNNQGRRS